MTRTADTGAYWGHKPWSSVIDPQHASRPQGVPHLEVVLGVCDCRLDVWQPHPNGQAKRP